MKRITSFVLIVALFVLCCPVYAAANEGSELEYAKLEVIVDKNGKQSEIMLPVIVREGELFIEPQKLQEITRYRLGSGENKHTYLLGKKQVTIDYTEQTLKVNLNDMPFSGTLYVDGVHYLPMSEILPWMNVECYLDSNHRLHIDSDIKSFWEVINDFTPADYMFNLSEMFGDSVGDVVGLAAIGVFDCFMDLGNVWKRVVPINETISEGEFVSIYEYEIYKQCFRELALPTVGNEAEAAELISDLSGLVSDGSQVLNSYYKGFFSEELFNRATEKYGKDVAKILWGETPKDPEVETTAEFLKQMSTALKYMKTGFLYLTIAMTDTTDYAEALRSIYLSERKSYPAGVELAASEAIIALESQAGAIADGAATILAEAGMKFLEGAVEETVEGMVEQAIQTKVSETFFGSLGLYLDIIDATLTIVWPVNEAYEEVMEMTVYQGIQYDASSLYSNFQSFQKPISEQEISNTRTSALIILKTAMKCYEAMQQTFDLYGGEGVLNTQIELLEDRITEFELSALAEENDAICNKSEITAELRALFSELDLVVTEKPTSPDADNGAALLAYAQMLREGVWLRLDNDDLIPASHYSLLDMNADGCSEIIVFAVDNYVPTFEIYTYSDGDVLKIADSLDTCDVSKWYNASNYVYICDGRYVFAGADKATAAYQAASFALLKYDGQSVNAEESNMYSVQTGYDVCKLVECGEIVGGTEIGSDVDTLSSREEPTETEPTETEPSTPRSGYSVEMLLEGGMDLLLAVCDDFQYSEGYDDYGAGHLDGEEFTVAFDPRTGVIERITIWKMGGSLEITDGVYSDMSYQELRNAWKGTSGWTDIQYDFMYGGSNPETDVHDAYVEFAWGESGSGSSDWSSWSWDRQSVGANQEEEVRTVWGYYYYPCAECGAHMHGYGDTCWTWAGGCGAAKIPHDWHEVWSTVSWEDANLRDWHGTGKFYTYIDGELVFKWTEHGSARQQYRYRTVGSSTPAYQVTLSFCTPIAETGNIPVVQLITIERTRTGRSGGELADGEYYGRLLDWDDSNMTIELLDFQGWYEESMNRILESTGRNVSLDTTHSSVWLEWAWMSEESDIWCSSIDAALDTKIWGGNTTVRESCTMTIMFNVTNGSVAEIVILYAS